MKTKEGTSGLSMIKPTSFYSSKKEKIKFNWFSYELSMTVFDQIKKDTGNLLRSDQIGDKDLALFSIFFSKNMQNIILQKIAGEIDMIYISPEMIELYFPDIGDKLKNKMLDAILKAWDQQLSFCEICPTRCVSEKELYCPMFDEELSDCE
ncbi:MAG: hypothetical protein Q7U51_00980 [Methanoregula sp.]|nr:hypothetical protein [Methanoregula sp.]